MGMFKRLKQKLLPDPPLSHQLARRQASARRVLARYDAAQTTRENSKHWAQADQLSAAAATNADVRRIVRSRSRHEVANNSYASGMIGTLADYVIGTGPKLQLLTKDEKANRLVEQAFEDWGDEIGLAELLHTMCISAAESGEVFGLLTTNKGLESRVKLDLNVIESDQVAAPYPVYDSQLRSTDGIALDANNKPKSYYVLKNHPGEALFYNFSVNEFEVVPADKVVHLFHRIRPGQFRGIPWTTPALPIFAVLRRYTLAALHAAEQAAMASGVIYTDSPPDAVAASVDPLDQVDMERGTWLTMPAGWKIGQMKAEQPPTTYEMFKREVLNEIARCLKIPYNIAAGNSSSYNYASGRLDHQAFFKYLKVERKLWAFRVINRLFRAWLSEAILVEGFLPQSLRMTTTEILFQWFWDGFEHVDPAKEATAQSKRLALNTTTLAAEYAKEGKDWEKELRQRATERKLWAELMKGVKEPETSKKEPV